MKLSSPGGPVASESASVRSVGDALHCFSVRLSHVGSLSYLLSDNDVKPHSFTFPYALFDLVQVVPGDRCLMDEDILNEVIVINEAVPILDIKPFNGSKHSPSSASAQVEKAVLHPLMSCGLPVLSQGTDIGRLLAWDGLDKPDPQAFYLCLSCLSV